MRLGAARGWRVIIHVDIVAKHYKSISCSLKLFTFIFTRDQAKTEILHILVFTGGIVSSYILTELQIKQIVKIFFSVRQFVTHRV